MNSPTIYHESKQISPDGVTLNVEVLETMRVDSVYPDKIFIVVVYQTRVATDEYGEDRIVEHGEPTVIKTSRDKNSMIRYAVGFPMDRVMELTDEDYARHQSPHAGNLL